MRARGQHVLAWENRAFLTRHRAKLTSCRAFLTQSKFRLDPPCAHTATVRPRRRNSLGKPDVFDMYCINETANCTTGQQ